MLKSFGTLDALILSAYLIANLALGLAMSRRIRSAADFHIGDRSAPWWAIGISVVATYVSALSFLGGPAWAYGDGMAALAIHLNYPLVIFVVVTLFLPFFFNSGVASIYEYLERRFGVVARTVMSALFLFTQLVTTASIVTATAVVVTFVTGIDARYAIVAILAVVLLYTLVGGMNAVIWTDVLQGVILFAGAGVVLYHVLGAVSPLSTAVQTLDAAGKLDPLRTGLDFSVAPTVWAGVFAMTLFHITVYGANQMMVQRALAAKSIGDAKKSYLLMGYAGFFIYLLFFSVGALPYVHFEGRPFDQPNEIVLLFADSLAIPGLMGLLVAAILSASMSTLSSALNSLATVSIADFYQRFLRQGATDRHYLTMSRVFVLCWAAMTIPIAFTFIESKGSILETLSRVASYFVGAKLAMFGLGFLSKHTTERGLLVGVVAGFVGLYITVVGLPVLGWSAPAIAWPWYVVIGGGINIIVSWIASIVLDGFQKDWHPQTVQGQRRRFREQGLAEMQDGWHLVPGRIDRSSWALIVLFVIIMLTLANFRSLLDRLLA
jgi:SSS family solute:Na+ symporter